MKIERLQIDNFLGARRIDIRLTDPVLLIAGPNGACKSSIGEAVRMAMGHDVVRVKLKKEYGQLVSEGELAGGALITVDDDRTYAFNVPAGEFKADDGLPTGENVDISLNGQRFASMTGDERRTYLFGLAGVRPKTDDIKKRMEDRKCDPAKIEAALPMLRTGFPAASDFAAKKATEAKGSWRAVTNKTYGPKQAEGWKAAAPDPIEGAVPTAETLKAFDEDIAEMNKQVGAIAAETRARADAAARRQALEKAASTVDQVREALDCAKKNLAEYEPSVIALRQRAAGGRPLGLVHDLAYALEDLTMSTAKLIPTEEKVVADAFAALEAYEEEHGEINRSGAIDVDAKNSLPEYERGLEVMQNAVKNYQRDLDAAVKAKGEFDALAPDEKQEQLPDLAMLQESLVTMRAERAAVQGRIMAAAAHDKEVAAAKQKTKDAAKHHSDVAAWGVVADALAPDGIPGDLLIEALLPINNTLDSMHDMTGWMRVCISSDMQITAAGRPYHLLSESEKWRTDAMIAATAATLSGIKILMLDRVDVLDLPGRSKLLGWVGTMTREGDIDTALLFATLKALPAKMMPGMAAHWVEAGSVVEMQEAA